MPYDELYSKINNESFIKWNNDNSMGFNSKEEFINHLMNLPDDQVTEYENLINRYELLIKNKTKNTRYEKLYDELDNSSLDSLIKIDGSNSPKGILILNMIEKYTDDEIKYIFLKEKVINQYQISKSLSIAAKEVGLEPTVVLKWYFNGSKKKSLF